VLPPFLGRPPGFAARAKRVDELLRGHQHAHLDLRSLVHGHAFEALLVLQVSVRVNEDSTEQVHQRRG
jgi:hypothetical protein